MVHEGLEFVACTSYSGISYDYLCGWVGGFIILTTRYDVFVACFISVSSVNLGGGVGSYPLCLFM